MRFIKENEVEEIINRHAFHIHEYGNSTLSDLELPFDIWLDIWNVIDHGYLSNEGFITILGDKITTTANNHRILINGR